MEFSWNQQDLYNLIKELNVADQQRLDEAWEKSNVDHLPFNEVLLDKDIISDEDLGRAIAELMKVPFIQLSSLSLDPKVFMILPENFARKNAMIVFEEKKDTIGLAFNKPFDPKIIDYLGQKSGKKVTFHFATYRDMENAFGNYEKDLQKVFEKYINLKNEDGTAQNVTNLPVIALFEKLIEYAYKNRASDIHIEPEKYKSVIRLRIDGVLQEVLRFSREVHGQFISRVKYMAKLRTDEHMCAQDGKLQIPLEEEELDIRVSIVPVTHGEKCVLRLLAIKYRQFGLTDLGLEKDDLEKLKKSFKKPFGMVLATGPTGSGKTTTMYSILKILNTKQRNIATIEDPVEYDIEGVNQIQVNPKTNLNFADGLRSILRQDPNVIFVGEVRDNETAEISINSALTGHLVLTTLHTNDAPTVLPRFLEMKVEPYLVASTVSVVIAQRLLRRICQKCMYSYTVDLSELKLRFPSEVLKRVIGTKKTFRLYKGKGCTICHNTGYSGRVGIFEILEVTPKIQELITAKQNAIAIKEQAIKEGMRTMLEDGFRKSMSGLTTIDEVLLSTFD